MNADVYERLSVAKRVNGAGLLTRLGGSLMDSETLDAMREAAGAFVDIAELQTRAGASIARHTGTQAAIVTGGAAAALTLATAAAIARTDVALMERLPDTEGMANEVIIHRAHRTGYDHAIRAAGARLNEIGLNDRGVGAGVRDLEGWEIEAAIGPKTAAIAYTATEELRPSLKRVVAVAERFKLPVIVDAAAQLPPKENLRRFSEEGASLVAFSGGKAIRGPQGTGILCGREDLVASALIQMLDLDILPETWAPPEGLLARHFSDRFPHHGLGRGFKVDKESIVGLVVALERFVACDIEAVRASRRKLLANIAAGARELAHSRLLAIEEANGKYPTLGIEIDAAQLGLDAYAVSRALQRHDPPVHLSERRAWQGVLIVDSAGLREGDDGIVVAALRAVFDHRKSNPRMTTKEKT
ncbi:MAG: aminotransferase class V-fold PLP-dependent enzyme [Hyphomicrobiales bacterium]|nr:aminotransferase class V-fold PLP-dependent enzyme [Hyphomicrobiales bacterium]